MAQPAPQPARHGAEALRAMAPAAPRRPVLRQALHRSCIGRADDRRLGLPEADSSMGQIAGGGMPDGCTTPDREAKLEP